MSSEPYQVYNKQNKQFVKMKDGEILDNSYFKFDGVRMFGSGKPADHPSAEELAEQHQNVDSGNTRQSKKDDSTAENDKDSGNEGGGGNSNEDDESLVGWIF